jgi:DNA polymerase-1
LSAERIEDTEGIAHLLDEHRSKKLKTLAVEVLGDDDTIMIPYKSGQKKGELHAVSREAHHLRKVRNKLKLTKHDGYDKLPREVLVPYSLKDVELTLRLFDLLWPELRALPSVEKLYRHEMELMLVTLDVEAAGIRVDGEYLDATIKETNLSILQAEKEVERITGLKVWYPPKTGKKDTPEGCINPNAWQQLLPAFAARGINLPNTRDETLKATDDDLARAVSALRKQKKLLSTYLLNIKREKKGDLIHPNFKLFHVVTGRFSSGKAEE